VWPFAGQSPADAQCLVNSGLVSHTIRQPKPEVLPLGEPAGRKRGRARGALAAYMPVAIGRLPLEVYPLSAVRRAVHARPAE
jgi:hypothetical protein